MRRCCIQWSEAGPRQWGYRFWKSSLCLIKSLRRVAVPRGTVVVAGLLRRGIRAHNDTASQWAARWVFTRRYATPTPFRQTARRLEIKKLFFRSLHTQSGVAFFFSFFFFFFCTAGSNANTASGWKNQKACWFSPFFSFWQWLLCHRLYFLSVASLAAHAKSFVARIAVLSTRGSHRQG